MSEERFNLVFKGQLAKGADMNTTVRNLAQLFKIDQQKAKALFGGQATILKRDLDMDTGNKYRTAIKKAGAIADLQAVEAPKASPSTSAKPTAAAPQPTSRGRAVFGEREPGSSQSTSTPQPFAPKKPAEDEGGLTTSIGVFGATRPAPATEVNVPNYGLSAAGADLLSADEKRDYTEANIDTSGLSLKENEGNLLNEDEYEEFVPLPIDVGVFDIAPAGTDLLKPQERKKEVVTQVDTSGLSLGKLGENLAPPKPAAPKPPDTSDISLADH